MSDPAIQAEQLRRSSTKDKLVLKQSAKNVQLRWAMGGNEFFSTNKTLEAPYKHVDFDHSFTTIKGKFKLRFENDNKGTFRQYPTVMQLINTDMKDTIATFNIDLGKYLNSKYADPLVEEQDKISAEGNKEM